MRLKNNTVLLILGVIFLTGLIFRTVYLDNVPVSLTIDEVAEVYNSLSILETGRDEHGVWFPLIFKSIGDYKSPLLFYTMIPAMAIFGLTEFGTRITTALLGSLTIILVFWIAKLTIKNNVVPLIAAFSVAISPWHIKPSRMTHDAVLALFLVLLGVGFFLKSSQYKFKNLWISAIFFGLSMYAYHTEKVFVPLLLLTLVLIYSKELLANKRQTLIAIVTGLILTAPLIVILATPQGRSRGESTFIARDFELNRTFHKDTESLSLPQNLLDNNLVLAVNFWFKRYLNYFDPNFIFVNGMGFDLPGAPDVGLLYLFELPFVLTGLYIVIFRQGFVDKKSRKLLLLWVLIGPVAASLANNSQHALRNLTSIPLFQIFSGIGIYDFYKRITRPAFRFFFIGIMILFVVYGLVYFSNLYFVHNQYFYSEYAMDGWKQAAEFALENQHKYKEVVIDPRFGTQGPFTVGTPYLYILFYGKISPIVFQNDPRRKEFETSSNFRKFTFREIDWRGGVLSDQDKKDTLFIGSKWVLPAKDEEILKKFYLLNGKEILRAVVPR